MEKFIERVRHYYAALTLTKAKEKLLKELNELLDDFAKVK